MNTEELFQRWSEVRQGLCQALESLNNAQLDFVPHAGLWSLREVICHMAGAEEGWFRYCVTHEINEWPEYPAADYATIASLQALIAEVHARTEQYFKKDHWANADAMMNQKISLPWGEETHLGWIVWHVLEHEIHHRGEIFLMLGLMGLRAPDV